MAAAKASTAQPAPLSQSDERTWAMVAHLSVLVNLTSGFLGPIIALLIYVIFKDRSRYLAYQSMQAFIFQLVAWVGAGALVAGVWIVTGITSILLIGLLCIPFACLISALPLASVVYGVVGGVEAARGEDFRYWLIGDWVRSIYESE